MAITRIEQRRNGEERTKEVSRQDIRDIERFGADPDYYFILRESDDVPLASLTIECPDFDSIEYIHLVASGSDDSGWLAHVAPEGTEVA